MECGAEFACDGVGKFEMTQILSYVKLGVNGHLEDGRINWQTDFAKEKNPYKKIIPIWTLESVLTHTEDGVNAPEGADQNSEYKNTNSSSESLSSEEISSIQNESKENGNNLSITDKHTNADGTISADVQTDAGERYSIVFHGSAADFDRLT